LGFQNNAIRLHDIAAIGQSPGIRQNDAHPQTVTFITVADHTMRCDIRHRVMMICNKLQHCNGAATQE
jgi:hypothetical protein